MILLLAWVVAGAVALPVMVLAIECAVGACLSAGEAQDTPREPCIVLMPAHDEACGIAAAVAAVLAQLSEGDELVVVADNCTDDTAAIACASGATVVERADPMRRGKGHALEFGRAFIERQRFARRFATVLVIDADCLPLPGAIAALANAAQRRDAVVQGAYLMTAPPDAEPVVRISCLAFLIKNLVRQLALDRLAGAALLQGSGMAFPRTTFARMRWSAASLVEDLDMGVGLLLSGERVVFEGSAGFVSAASSARGTAGQRRRWEHGMVQSARRFVPRLLAAGVSGRPRLAMVALDLLVPPTVLLIVMLGAVTLLSLAVAGPAGPTLLLLGSGLALALALAAAWWRHGRKALPAASLGRIPGYVLWKLPLLAQFVTRRERDWIRTERR